MSHPGGASLLRALSQFLLFMLVTSSVHHALSLPTVSSAEYESVECQESSEFKITNVRGKYCLTESESETENVE